MLATGGCVNPIELKHLDPRGWMVGGTTNPNLLTTRRPIGSTLLSFANFVSWRKSSEMNSADRGEALPPQHEEG
jgi:hypothetical protein